MKKILLMPTTLLAAITPIIATTSCNNSKDPEKTKYAFEFTGNHCKINNQQHFVTQIEENTKVEYGILPDEGFKLSATQDLPQGVTLTGGLLTIARMDKAYTVTINAEPIQRSLVISGIKTSYTGELRETGHTDSISVTLSEDGKEKDVTDLVTFNPVETAPMIWDRTNKWFTWSDTVDADEYECSFTANYLDIISSETCTTTLTINSGEKLLVCEGLIDAWQYTGGVNGEISPITFWAYDDIKAQRENVTSQVEAEIEMIDPTGENILHWDGLDGKLWWNNATQHINYYFIATFEYTDDSFPEWVCNINIQIN